MRVFVTGATGFVGVAVVKELLSHGHTVLGLTRSDKGASQLRVQGAEPLHGTLADLETLKQGASSCDAVIHLAFVHDFSDYLGACATDRAAIAAFGAVFAGSRKPLVITSGAGMFPNGQIGDEDSPVDTENPMAVARGKSEKLCLDLAAAQPSVNAMIVRLPPTTHGAGSSGFAGIYVAIALRHGVAAYIGDGRNHWSAGSREDAAVLYRLAVEKGPPGGIYHAVGEEAVEIKDVADEVGRLLDVPVVSLPAGDNKVGEHFGWFAHPMAWDNRASSAKTRERLGWKPTGPTLVEQLPRVVEYIKAHRDEMPV